MGRVYWRRTQIRAVGTTRTPATTQRKPGLVLGFFVRSIHSLDVRYTLKSGHWAKLGPEGRYRPKADVQTLLCIFGILCVLVTGYTS
jgi:hypothetical protein